MKRFVTYIYQYSRGIRGKNVGFIKTDIRDSGCRMEIHIRGLERFQGHAQIYLIVSGENMGIPSGVIPIGQGIGHITLSFAHNLLGDSGYTIDQVQAVVIRYGGGQLLASCWSDHVPAEILLGQFDIYSGAPEKADNPTPPPASNDSGKRIVPIQLRPENGASAHTIRLDSGLPSGVAPAPDLRSGSEPRTDADADSVARSDTGANPDSGSHAVTAASDSNLTIDSDSGADSDSVNNSDSGVHSGSGSHAATAAPDSNSAINSGLGVDSDSISSSDFGANSGSGSYAVTAATPDSDSANDSGFGVDSDSVSSSDSGRNSDSGTPAVAANPNSSPANDSGFGLDSDSVARSDAREKSGSGSSAVAATPDSDSAIDSDSGADSDSISSSDSRANPDSGSYVVTAATPDSSSATGSGSGADSDSSPADDSGDRTSENSASISGTCQKSNVDSTSENPALPPKITYQKIEITDIRKLPKKNWYLCNNSFLIHGFFNYHHLMLKTIETDGQKKCYLGVPGIYEQPERMMALLFGFPEFEPARSQTDPHGTDLTADTPVPAAAQYSDDNSAADTPPSDTASNRQESDIPNSSTGVFGYWMCTCHVSP